ncbi:hypothetical protein ACFZDK_19505 [Streptomyces sp. NPDC007901]
MTRSVWQMPAALRRTRTSSGRGSEISTSWRVKPLSGPYETAA